MPSSVHFPEANDIVGHAGCLDMPVKIDKVRFGDRMATTITSCWQFTPEEIAEFNQNGGKVFFTFFGGQPVMSVTMGLPKEAEPITMTFDEIARKMSENLDGFTIVEHGEGRVYLTFLDGSLQFDLDKDQYRALQNVYGNL